jgi:hypothetical protein
VWTRVRAGAAGQVHGLASGRARGHTTGQVRVFAAAAMVQRMREGKRCRAMLARRQLPPSRNSTRQPAIQTKNRRFRPVACKSGRWAGAQPRHRAARSLAAMGGVRGAA